MISKLVLSEKEAQDGVIITKNQEERLDGIDLIPAFRTGRYRIL